MAYIIGTITRTAQNTLICRLRIHQGQEILIATKQTDLILQ